MAIRLSGVAISEIIGVESTIYSVLSVLNWVIEQDEKDNYLYSVL
jgi:hypothetical protein